MKLIKLTAVTAAVLGSTAAMAAVPANNYNVQPINAQPAYQYNPNAGVIHNTTGAIASTGKTLFNTVTHPGAISAEIGTLGYGANIAWGLNETTELQAGWSGMSFDDDTELNSNDSWINYEKVLGDGYENFKGDFYYDVDFSNPYLGVQMRPMRNWFTVGAGVMVPRNSIDARLVATDVNTNKAEVTIDDVGYSFSNDSVIDLEIENKNKLAPYATLGLRPNINDKWGMFAEVGAAYMGDIKSNVKVSEGTVTALNADGTPAAVGADAKRQFEDAAEKELADDDDIWYPIAKVGVTYRF